MWKPNTFTDCCSVFWRKLGFICRVYLERNAAYKFINQFIMMRSVAWVDIVLSCKTVRQFVAFLKTLSVIRCIRGNCCEAQPPVDSVEEWRHDELFLRIRRSSPVWIATKLPPVAYSWGLLPKTCNLFC